MSNKVVFQFPQSKQAERDWIKIGDDHKVTTILYHFRNSSNKQFASDTFQVIIKYTAKV